MCTTMEAPLPPSTLLLIPCRHMVLMTSHHTTFLHLQVWIWVEPAMWVYVHQDGYGFSGNDQLVQSQGRSSDWFLNGFNFFSQAGVLNDPPFFQDSSAHEQDDSQQETEKNPLKLYFDA